MCRSVVCSSYDKLEEGAPSFEERLEIAINVAPSVKRLIVRIQPYMHEVYGEVYENLEKFKAAGAYGVIVEGIEFLAKADVAIFAPGWKNARGCRIEHQCAEDYGIPVMEV